MLFGFLYSKRIEADAVKRYQAQFQEEGTTSPLIEQNVEEGKAAGEENDLK